MSSRFSVKNSFGPEKRWTEASFVTFVGIVLALLLIAATSFAAQLWVSPDHFRTLLTVDPKHTSFSRGVNGIHSPTSVEIDFAQLIAAQGGVGTFDEDTIEVIAYDSAGQPKVYDATRIGYEQYLLPRRIERYYGVSRVKLCFAMPDHATTQYMVYFDTKESRLGKPTRYPGMVGDGDWFTEGYKRREMNASSYDTFYDFDLDGDLDLFKGGTEPFIYVYENVGGNKFVDRGKLTSGGQPLVLDADGNNRTWGTIRFCDWDGDGDADLFVQSPTGNYGGQLVWYKNVTTPGGQLTFAFQGQVYSSYNSQPVGVSHSGGAIVTFCDWDGDGDTDLLVGQDAMIEVHENIGTKTNPQLRFKQYVQANGTDIQLLTANCDYTDVDGDGLPDLFVSTEEGRVYLFKNVGTRANPQFREGQLVVYYAFMDQRAGIKVADWDGDGLQDIVIGRYWQRAEWGSDQREYGHLYKNVGSLTSPRFEARDAYAGSPYTERFQICDAVRQNGLRCVDWNNDGRKDLIVGDTDGFVWYFRNTTNQLFPIFAPGQRMQAGGDYIRVWGEEKECRAAGYARVEVCDWNGDGKKDLLVADGRGWLWAFLNTNTDADPVLGAGFRVVANGLPIDGTPRGSVLVCDWDNDTDMDLVYGMVGRSDPSPADSQYYDWPHQTGNADPGMDKGFLLYTNVGAGAGGLPTLIEPSWLMSSDSGGQSNYIQYTRPNVGSFVDWDADGKKDFIGCEFETSVRFYKNTGTRSVPAFTSGAAGQTIVQPWTNQMISGADAVDWDGDGDLDILTGQGHGGSGLRFYERDQINDFLNNAYPTVTIGSTLTGYEISSAKAFKGKGSITIPQAIVTGVYSDCFYVESSDRRVGLRASKTSSGLAVGQRVDVTGAMGKTADGERQIVVSSTQANGTGTVAEMSLNTRILGGGSYCYDPNDQSGQIGVDGSMGLNNIGLLVKLAGKCSLNLSSTGDYYGKRYFFIDDGAGMISNYRTIDGSWHQVNGVKVDSNDSTITVGRFLSVRGISSLELANGRRQSKILTRTGLNDITKL
jgi:hypothetical protein